MSRPFYPDYFDRGFQFLRERMFWGLMLGGTYISFALYKRYFIEVHRAQRTERLNMSTPSFHMSQRGSVVLEKQFMGFEKYYKNSGDMINWYKARYPQVFQKE